MNKLYKKIVTAYKHAINKNKIKISFDMSIDFKKILNENNIVQYQIVGARLPDIRNLPTEYFSDRTHIYVDTSHEDEFTVFTSGLGYLYYNVNKILECYEFDELVDALHESRANLNLFHEYITRITTITNDIGTVYRIKG